LVVLAAPAAGIPEIIDDGRTGFLTGAADHEGYANRIAWLLGHRDRWSEVAEAALAQVRANHRIDRFCRSVLESYDALAEARWRRQ
jgi:glycosyltransferase involved in cell wall biosynthesis